MKKRDRRERRVFKRRIGAAAIYNCVFCLAIVGVYIFPVAAIHAEDQVSPRVTLLQLRVFAKGSIHAERSDYQGPAAAGGEIVLADFKVDGDLSSGQGIQFRDGQLSGTVNAPTAALSRVFSSGRRSIDRRDFEIASLTLDLLGARLSALRPTTTFASFSPTVGTTEFTAAARDGLAVVDLDGDQLASGGETGPRIVLVGDEQASILVRVHGHSIRLDHVGFSAEGGLKPSRIVFFFPEARDLEIMSSGGARDKAGRLWDIPGSVVAPDADMRFAASTIDGQLFARSIASIDGLPSGQVNRFPQSEASGAATSGFEASSLLQMVSGESAGETVPGFSPRLQSAVAATGDCKLVCRSER